MGSHLLEQALRELLEGRRCQNDSPSAPVPPEPRGPGQHGDDAGSREKSNRAGVGPTDDPSAKPRMVEPVNTSEKSQLASETATLPACESSPPVERGAFTAADDSRKGASAGGPGVAARGEDAGAADKGRSTSSQSGAAPDGAQAGEPAQRGGPQTRICIDCQRELPALKALNRCSTCYQRMYKRRRRAQQQDKLQERDIANLPMFGTLSAHGQLAHSLHEQLLQQPGMLPLLKQATAVPQPQPPQPQQPLLGLSAEHLAAILGSVAATQSPPQQQQPLDPMAAPCSASASTPAAGLDVSQVLSLMLLASKAGNFGEPAAVAGALGLPAPLTAAAPLAAAGAAAKARMASVVGQGAGISGAQATVDQMRILLRIKDQLEDCERQKAAMEACLADAQRLLSMYMALPTNSEALAAAEAMRRADRSGAERQLAEQQATERHALERAQWQPGLAQPAPQPAAVPMAALLQSLINSGGGCGGGRGLVGRNVALQQGLAELNGLTALLGGAAAPAAERAGPAASTPSPQCGQGRAGSGALAALTTQAQAAVGTSFRTAPHAPPGDAPCRTPLAGAPGARALGDRPGAAPSPARLAAQANGSDTRSLCTSGEASSLDQLSDSSSGGGDRQAADEPHPQALLAPNRQAQPGARPPHDIKMEEAVRDSMRHAQHEAGRAGLAGVQPPFVASPGTGLANQPATQSMLMAAALQSLLGLQPPHKPLREGPPAKRPRDGP